MVHIICQRCNKRIIGNDEYSAEVKFNNHKCKGMRDLMKMPHDLLTKVVKKELTEAEAWKIADQRG